MPRLATLTVLFLSLLAVASCRVLEAESAISDEQGPSNPADLTQEADAAEVILSSLPAPAIAEDEGVLWLPSHHCPCHRSHLWWARHRGLSHSHHRGTLSGPGEARVLPAVFFRTDTELDHGEEHAHTEAELEAVAESDDPDSRPDTDGDQKPFHAKEQMSVKAWKVEMARFFGHHLHHHHEHEEDNDDDHEQDKDEGTNMKLFGRFHHRHHHEEDEQEQHKDEGMIMKLLRRFHHHGNGEANEAEPERGRGYNSFKVLMNRF